MVLYEILIGKSLQEAIMILNERKISYEVLMTQGKKDADLLKEPYVIAVRQKEKIQIIASNFLTRIGK